MTLQELKQMDWYKERPKVIQDAIEILPPITLYKFKNSGKQCHIVSYEEPESGEAKDVTVTVQKTEKGGVMADAGLGMLDFNAVLGLRLDDLEPWQD